MAIRRAEPGLQLNTLDETDLLRNIVHASHFHAALGSFAHDVFALCQSTPMLRLRPE